MTLAHVKGHLDRCVLIVSSDLHLVSLNTRELMLIFVFPFAILLSRKVKYLRSNCYHAFSGELMGKLMIWEVLMTHFNFTDFALRLLRLAILVVIIDIVRND